MRAFPQIVVGTYEEFVLGYNLNYENEAKKKINFHQTFATHSHQASVRCIATYKNLMASSGADEYINIYDMIALEVSTVINYHDSTVTCLQFTPDGSHLISGNQNGDIAIFQCRDWTLVKLWKEAHKHACGVTSMSVHNSGSLLLTTGADNVLRFWNLVKGRQAYAVNFSKKCSVGNSLNFAVWSKSGFLYAVCIGNKVEIYTRTAAAVVYEINTKSRIMSCDFSKTHLCYLGLEDGSLEIYSIQMKCLLQTKKAHKIRIKNLAAFDINLVRKDDLELKRKAQKYIVSVDSEGGIKLWLLRRKELEYSLVLKGETTCDCRITCLAMVVPDAVKEEKQNSSDETKALNPVEDSFANEKNRPKNSENGRKQNITENGSGKIHSGGEKNIPKKVNKFKACTSSGPGCKNLIKKKRKNFEDLGKKKRKNSDEDFDKKKISKKLKTKTDSYKAERSKYKMKDTRV